jgi:hypothetical protein
MSPPKKLFKTLILFIKISHREIKKKMNKIIINKKFIYYLN